MLAVSFDFFTFDFAARVAATWFVVIWLLAIAFWNALLSVDLINLADAALLLFMYLLSIAAIFFVVMFLSGALGRLFFIALILLM